MVHDFVSWNQWLCIAVEPCFSFHSFAHSFFLFIHPFILFICKSFYVHICCRFDVIIHNNVYIFYNLLRFKLFDCSAFWVDSVIKYTLISLFIYFFSFCFCSVVVNFIWATQGMSSKVFHGIIYCIGRVCEKRKISIG